MSVSDALLADQFVACSDSLSGYLRQFGAKYLARITDAAVVTVEGWQAGRWPQSRHMVRLAEVLGQPFLDAAFGPVIAADAPLALRMARVEDEIKSIRREIEDAERNTARAHGARADGSGAVARARGAVDRGITAARRVTAGIGLFVSLLAPVQEVLAPGDDDDWARFFRAKPAAARVIGGARRIES